MPLAVPATPEAGPSKKCKIAKLASLSVVAILLLFLGQAGRRHAQTDLTLRQLSILTSDLQRAMDLEQAAGPHFFDDSLQIPPRSPSPVPSTKVAAAAGSLQAALAEFDAENTSRLGKNQDLELRLSKATLANALRRYSEALTIITEADQRFGRPPSEAQGRSNAVVQQVLGDAYFGLHDLQHALAYYAEAGWSQPTAITIAERVAACQVELGKLDDALDTAKLLATSYNLRAGTLLMLSKQERAIADYETALKIQTWLTEKAGRTALSAELANTHDNLGGAFLVLGQSDAATQHFQKAVQLQVPTAEKTAQTTTTLAFSHQHLGDALLAQLKFDAALEQYDQALVSFARIPPSPLDEALIHNNRGVALRAKGLLPAAAQEFQAATQVLPRSPEEPLTEPQTTNSLKETDQDLISNASKLKIDVAIEYTDSGVELSVRPRLTKRRSRADSAVAYAVPLKNSARLYLAEGKPAAACKDLLQALDAYSIIVLIEGQADLSQELAAVLHELAWIYATTTDNVLRDGTKAANLARRACQLTGWKDSAPVAALAAASAELGNFSEAVKLQEKALALAPDQLKPELRARIALYESGKPCRN